MSKPTQTKTATGVPETPTTKVFIPDNQGGGTWETWKDDRPNYKAHAGKLAEALREIKRETNESRDFRAAAACAHIAHHALKAYDESAVQS